MWRERFECLWWEMEVTPVLSKQALFLAEGLEGQVS